MTEQEKANHFNAAVEQMLANGQVAPESKLADQSLLKLAQQLAAHNTRLHSKVEQMTRQMLLQRVGEREEPHITKGSKLMKTFSPRPRYQALSVSLALIAILVLITLTVPPVRAFAQEIIRQIGNFAISSAPTDAEQYVTTLESGTPTSTLDPQRVIPDEQIADRLTSAQAGKKAGFLVYEAAYIPAGYQLASRDVLTSTQSTTIDASYRMELDPPLHNGQQMAGIIAIEQILVYNGSPAWDKGVGDIPLIDVTVRGQPGVWLEQVPVIPFQDDQGEWDYARWNQLIWAEAGYTFMIQTNMPSDLLPLEELLKIAGSLVP
jgi:hypothetical protein